MCIGKNLHNDERGERETTRGCSMRASAYGSLVGDTVMTVTVLTVKVLEREFCAYLQPARGIWAGAVGAVADDVLGTEGIAKVAVDAEPAEHVYVGTEIEPKLFVGLELGALDVAGAGLFAHSRDVRHRAVHAKATMLHRGRDIELMERDVRDLIALANDAVDRVLRGEVAEE